MSDSTPPTLQERALSEIARDLDSMLVPYPEGATRTIQQINALIREAADALDKAEAENANTPTHLAEHSSRWLKANEKQPDDVRWGRFPLGMVQRWIERAEQAEARLREVEEERDEAVLDFNGRKASEEGAVAILNRERDRATRAEAEVKRLREVVEAARWADLEQQNQLRAAARGMRDDVARKYLDTPLHLALRALDQSTGDGVCDICGGQFSDLAGHKALGVKTHPWLDQSTGEEKATT